MATLAIGDVHAPFELPGTVDFLSEICREWKEIRRVVYCGDEADLHSFSLKYPSDPDGFSPGQELKEAIKHLKPFYKLFPKAFICESNHTIRIFKKAFAVGLPKATMKTYQELLQAPKDYVWAPEFIFDSVKYIHGEGFSSSSWMRASNLHMMSVVIGHVHSRPGVIYSNTSTRKTFSANAGAFLDGKQYAAAYAKTSIEKIGSGALIIVSSEEAYFVPMGKKFL